MNPPVTHPILLDVPESFESERMVIRMPLPGDGYAINAAIVESLEELKPFVHWANRPLQTPETSEAISLQGRVDYLNRNSFRLHLIDKQSGELVGCSGLFFADWHLRKFEIGYWMRTSYAGKGLMTEAIEAITRFGIEILGANRLEIRCDPLNVASTRIPEKLGYHLEGVLRVSKPDVHGNPADEAVYAKVRGGEF